MGVKVLEVGDQRDGGRYGNCMIIPDGMGLRNTLVVTAKSILLGRYQKFYSPALATSIIVHE